MNGNYIDGIDQKKSLENYSSKNIKKTLTNLKTVARFKKSIVEHSERNVYAFWLRNLPLSIMISIIKSHCEPFSTSIFY